MMQKYSRRIYGNSYSTSSTSHHNIDQNKEVLRCRFCGLQCDHKNVFGIHIFNCKQRKEQQRCKICKSSIQLWNPDQQYCAKCSITMDKSQEYNLRFKATNQTAGFASKSSKTVVPEKIIETSDLIAVNCTKAKSSLSRKRIAATSDSLKLKEGKSKRKVAKHQMTEKQSQSLRVENAAEVSTDIKFQSGMKPSCELHEAPDKLYKSSLRNTVHQKKNFLPTGTEVDCEKLNTNSQKTMRRPEEKSKQPSKKSDCLPVKSNPTHEKVTLELLLCSIPKNKCGMLLRPSPTNNIWKCCMCGKAFRGIRTGSQHYSSCTSTKFIKTLVDVSCITWVCTICHVSFPDVEKLMNHSKGCKILTKNYDNACGELCEKCHFKCMSPVNFQNHNCTKILDSMKACSVRLNVVKINSVMRECEFCAEIFDEQETDKHFLKHHPGETSSGKFKQYFVNINRGPSTNTVVVKSEPVFSNPESVKNSECTFEGSEHYSCVNSRQLSNPDISMPPPSSNLPVRQSSANLQFPSAQTGGLSSSHHSASEGAMLINRQICKCINRNVRDDTKPCLQCLNRLDITKFSSDLKLLPFRVAKIKQEASEDLGVLNVNIQVDGNTAPCSPQMEKELEQHTNGTQLLDGCLLPGGLFNSPYTPPSSHNGTSPPGTPSTSTLPHSLVDNFPASDVNMGYSSEDISMATLPSPEDPNTVENFPFNDDDPSLALPLMSDNPELYPCEMTYISQEDNDNYNMVDAWAVVSSEGDETAEKYICSDCLFFSCLDQESILRHLYENHEKKLQYLAMYVCQEGSDPPSSDDES